MAVLKTTDFFFVFDCSLETLERCCFTVCVCRYVLNSLNVEKKKREISSNK